MGKAYRQVMLQALNMRAKIAQAEIILARIRFKETGSELYQCDIAYWQDILKAIKKHQKKNQR